MSRCPFRPLASSGRTSPDPNREAAELALLRNNSERLQKSFKRIRESMSQECASALGAKDVDSAKDRTNMRIGFAPLGALRYNSGRPTRDAGPMAQYSSSFFNFFDRQISLNTAVNWEDPSKTLAYVDGNLSTVDLLAGEAARLEISKITAEQFIDLTVLHEIKHSFGGEHDKSIT